MIGMIWHIPHFSSAVRCKVGGLGGELHDIVVISCPKPTHADDLQFAAWVSLLGSEGLRLITPINHIVALIMPILTYRLP